MIGGKRLTIKWGKSQGIQDKLNYSNISNIGLVNLEECNPSFFMVEENLMSASVKKLKDM